jgi:tyrosyl-tRNA synthetase
LIVALLLALAGVPHDVIAADYALSEIYLRPLQQSAQEAQDGKEPLAADARTMLGALAHIEIQHGGVETYLLESGVAPSDIVRIRERLVEPTSPDRTVQSGMQNVLDILHERGFIQQISDEVGLRMRIDQGPITLYNGYDATADSLHVGNLVSIMMLAWFQRCGHRPIALLGGGTTLVGDPSGRQTSRPMLSEEEINRRMQTIKGQFGRFLDFEGGRALLVNNAQWLTELRFVDFMRDIGSRFSVNEVLRLEAYDTRLKAGGMTFLELSYVLMQSYDFLRLYEDYDCILQTGGSDQWGNSIMGADLVRRVTGGEAFVLTVPLIEATSGRKMGKSEAGAVWLSAEKLSPYDYYQFWRNTPDADVERFLAIFTFLPMEEVRDLGSREAEQLNESKERLAFEATMLLHGEEQAWRAERASRALFARSGSHEDIPTIAMDCSRLGDGIAVTDLFRDVGLVSSANEARRQIQQGGLSVNGHRVADPKAMIDRDSFQDGAVLLRRGKKDYRRVICREG